MTTALISIFLIFILFVIATKVDKELEAQIESYRRSSGSYGSV